MDRIARSDVSVMLSLIRLGPERAWGFPHRMLSVAERVLGPGHRNHLGYIMSLLRVLGPLRRAASIYQAFAMCLVLLSLLSCFPFSGDEKHLDGPYYLWEGDVSEDMALYYRVNEDSGVNRIPSTVFAVGWDKRHIIAKRHPNNDRSITEYYILDRSKDAPLADPSTSITGPLTGEQFEVQRRVLGVSPSVEFSYVARSLE